MRIAIGADHRGYKMKQALVEYLRSKGHRVLDLGTHTPDPCDYPRYGWEVARSVARGGADRGVLVCHSGIGQSIVANKVRGVRAALVTDATAARLSREHNDSNVMVLSSLKSTSRDAKRILSVWLKTRASGGRHARRVREIMRLERLELDRGQGKRE
ncbi:MAG: ribose 5-phosphate isomerase B [Candidatus Omnitrophica bacterium]|nr:ribose 5-phosphate isomerase B [Candidatus Omnitrophota bacterium]